MTHLALLDHFTVETFGTFDFDEADSTSFRRLTMSNAMVHSFLMYQLLATSAIHLSFRNEETQVFYCQQASLLRDRALVAFTRVAIDLDAKASFAALLFSSLVGHQSFIETVIDRTDDFASFMKRLAKAFDVMRGSRTIAGRWWPEVRSADLARMFDVTSRMDDFESENAPSHKVLQDMLSASTLDVQSLEVCREAADLLARLFMLADALDEEGERSLFKGASLPFIWPPALPEGFSNLLDRLCPEALVILAHYGALLHRRQYTWEIGDSGKFLIVSIHSHLSKEFRKWTRLPVRMVVRNLKES